MSSWVVVYKSTNYNNIQITKAILEEQDINVVLIDKRDSVNTHLINAEMELHVNPQNVIKAKHLITKHEL